MTWESSRPAANNTAPYSNDKHLVLSFYDAQLSTSSVFGPPYLYSLMHNKFAQSNLRTGHITRLAMEMKLRIHIHIHRFYVDIHGYIHIHRCLSCIDLHVSNDCPQISLFLLSAAAAAAAAATAAATATATATTTALQPPGLYPGLPR